MMEALHTYCGGCMKPYTLFCKEGEGLIAILFDIQEKRYSKLTFMSFFSPAPPSFSQRGAEKSSEERK